MANNPSVIKSHVQKTKQNPHGAVSRKKAIRHPHRRPKPKPKVTGKNGNQVKMEAWRREAGNSVAPKAMTAQS